MMTLWMRLRFASAGELGLFAALALVASLVLDKIRVPGSGLFSGILFAVAVGFAVYGCGVWQRRRHARG